MNPSTIMIARQEFPPEDLSCLTHWYALRLDSLSSLVAIVSAFSVKPIWSLHSVALRVIFAILGHAPISPPLTIPILTIEM